MSKGQPLTRKAEGCTLAGKPAVLYSTERDPVRPSMCRLVIKAMVLFRPGDAGLFREEGI